MGFARGANRRVLSRPARTRREAEAGTVRETIVGEFAWFSAACLWTRGGVQYQSTLFDILGDDWSENPLATNTGYVSVSQGGSNCLQPVAVLNYDPEIYSLDLHIEAVDNTYGQLTVHQTTQGYYRLDGEMMLGTGGSSIS